MCNKEVWRFSRAKQRQVKDKNARAARANLFFAN